MLPERIAEPVRAFRGISAPSSGSSASASPSPELITQLIEACTAASRLRLSYRMRKSGDKVMEVDPWAVVLRHSRWYLLGWSHTRQAQRVLRADRIVTARLTPETFTPPRDLDALRALEEQLSRVRLNHDRDYAEREDRLRGQPGTKHGQSDLDGHE